MIFRVQTVSKKKNAGILWNLGTVAVPQFQSIPDSVPPAGLEPAEVIFLPVYARVGILRFFQLGVGATPLPRLPDCSRVFLAFPVVTCFFVSKTCPRREGRDAGEYGQVDATARLIAIDLAGDDIDVEFFYPQDRED